MKVAIVLFNLGGPDSLGPVRPFLRNLFNDLVIIDAPGPVRWLLAHWISLKRAPIARGIYGDLGGSSPLLRQTTDQSQALEEQFNGDDEV